jgi:hypothetical protein
VVKKWTDDWMSVLERGVAPLYPTIGRRPVRYLSRRFKLAALGFFFLPISTTTQSTQGWNATTTSQSSFAPAPLVGRSCVAFHPGHPYSGLPAGLGSSRGNRRRPQIPYLNTMAPPTALPTGLCCHSRLSSSYAEQRWATASPPPLVPRPCTLPRPPALSPRPPQQP